MTHLPGLSRGADAGDVDRLRALLNATATATSLRGLEARVVLHHMFQFLGLAEVDGTLLEANQTALDAGRVERGT